MHIDQFAMEKQATKKEKSNPGWKKGDQLDLNLITAHSSLLYISYLLTYSLLYSLCCLHFYVSEWILYTKSQIFYWCWLLKNKKVWLLEIRKKNILL